MDKIKLEFKAPEKEKIEYNGVKIEVTPYLDFIQQTGLINKYVEDYFGEIENKLIVQSPYNFIEAEYNLKVYVIQTVTNIDVDTLVVEIVSDENLFDEISNCIYNYEDFLYRLKTVVNEIKSEISMRKSVGQVIDKVAGQLSGILSMFAEMSPEEIKELQEEGRNLLSELDNSAVISDTLGIKKGKKTK